MRKKRIYFLSVAVTLIAAFWLLFLSERKKILQQKPSAWFVDHRADCAIVLTGGPGRIREGFSLLSQGRVKKLIISGVYPQSSLRDIFPEFPFYGAISPSDVVLEKRSNTTFGNAQQSLPLVEALQCKSVVLITSTLHMYRAEKIFKRILSQDIEFSTRAITYGEVKPLSSEVITETIKSIFYSTWAYN
jgi:uncharacterized SAM-binding protein YcdF (DUF218 family)